MITLTYDALNRLTARNYPSGSGMTNVGYGYDSGTNGKGQRTSMSDALGANSTTYAFDNRGREITESRTIDSNNYTTQYTYDDADRLSTITYPTGEVVTQTYNGRGLPYTLSGTTAGSLVTGAYYNGLGSMTELDMKAV